MCVCGRGEGSSHIQVTGYFLPTTNPLKVLERMCLTFPHALERPHGSSYSFKGICVKRQSLGTKSGLLRPGFMEGEPGRVVWWGNTRKAQELLHPTLPPP